MKHKLAVVVGITMLFVAVIVVNQSTGSNGYLKGDLYNMSSSYEMMSSSTPSGVCGDSNGQCGGTCGTPGWECGWNENADACVCSDPTPSNEEENTPLYSSSWGQEYSSSWGRGYSSSWGRGYSSSSPSCNDPDFTPPSCANENNPPPFPACAPGHFVEDMGCVENTCGCSESSNGPQIRCQHQYVCRRG